LSSFLLHLLSSFSSFSSSSFQFEFESEIVCLREFPIDV
jgi:hypothetical protein